MKFYVPGFPDGTEAERRYELMRREASAPFQEQKVRKVVFRSNGQKHSMEVGGPHPHYAFGIVEAVFSLTAGNGFVAAISNAPGSGLCYSGSDVAEVHLFDN